MQPALKLVLLGAGGSRRMRGGDKLLESVDGLPLIRRQALAMLDAAVGPVAVTLPPDRPLREAALKGLPVERLTIDGADEGMSASLRDAARWAAGSGLLVAPADMPELDAADFAAVARAFDGATPLRATAADGTPGHPVVFPAGALADFARLKGDEGARSILKNHPPVLFALPENHAVTDLDTPEAWDAWRARTGGPAPRPPWDT